MKKLLLLLAAFSCVLPLIISCRQKNTNSCTVPVTLDHNRMLVTAEIQRADGTWREARLWIDTGNPEFFISESLAVDLGIDLLAAREEAPGGGMQAFEVPPLSGVRIGGLPLDFTGVTSKVIFQPGWLFSAMHNDANLPSTVLRRYHVVFDYPGLRLTLAEPGSMRPTGERIDAAVNPETGIVQIDAVVGGDSLGFALDNGASYSFTSAGTLERLSQAHPDWPAGAGAVGCANIWGWWPREGSWQVMRIPEMRCGTVVLADIGLVGLPDFFPNGMSVGDWYSNKTARPVNGFLGPNAFRAFRVEIDYANGAVYLEKSKGFDQHDMDIVGLTLRPEAGGGYSVIGVAERDGIPVVDGAESGDGLIQIDGLEVAGQTMGRVVDALRGRPGDIHTLLLEREGRQFWIEAEVRRLL